MITRTQDGLSSIAHEEWLSLVSGLVDQVEAWALEENWSIHRYTKRLDEENEVGPYDAPALRVRLPEGEVHVNPIARNVYGHADGRVDLEAWPSLNRVRLVRRKGEWEIITDSNIPLRRPWEKATFTELARDLVGGK
jgi:hypothetical protein